MYFVGCLPTVTAFIRVSTKKKDKVNVRFRLRDGRAVQLLYMSDLTVNPTACPFLPENLQLTLCHYPMVTWNKKPHGSIMLHGHCYGKLDEHNRLSNDLRFDVGIDGELAKRAGGFIPLELIYEAAMEKTGGVPFHQYAKQNYRSEVR